MNFGSMKLIHTSKDLQLQLSAYCHRYTKRTSKFKLVKVLDCLVYIDESKIDSKCDFQCTGFGNADSQVQMLVGKCDYGSKVLAFRITIKGMWTHLLSIFNLIRYISSTS